MLYSKISIIGPDCSSFLEFEKKDSIKYWSFDRDFFKKSRPGHLIEILSRYISKTVQLNFSAIVLVFY